MDYGIFLWKYIEFHTKKIILKIKTVTTQRGSILAG